MKIQSIDIVRREYCQVPESVVTEDGYASRKIQKHTVRAGVTNMERVKIPCTKS